MTVILAFDCLNLSFAITDHVRTGFPGAFPCFIGFKEHCPGVLPIVPDFSKSKNTIPATMRTNISISPHTYSGRDATSQPHKERIGGVRNMCILLSEWEIRLRRVRNECVLKKK